MYILWHIWNTDFKFRYNKDYVIQDVYIIACYVFLSSLSTKLNTKSWAVMIPTYELALVEIILLQNIGHRCIVAKIKRNKRLHIHQIDEFTIHFSCFVPSEYSTICLSTIFTTLNCELCICWMGAFAMYFFFIKLKKIMPSYMSQLA